MDELKTQSAVGSSEIVGQQTFADQIRLAGKARKYSKLQLVAELLESDRMLRADAAQIQQLGDEVRRLIEMLANSMFGPKSPAERSARRDSVISWAHDEMVGGDCQSVSFGQNAPQMKSLGSGHDGGRAPAAALWGGKGLRKQTPPVEVALLARKS